MTEGDTRMDELIARLEAASEGSRELDAAIHVLITPGGIIHPELPAGYTMTDLNHPQRNIGLARAPYLTTNRGPAPPYTTSLDAALTLAPEADPPARLAIERMYSGRDFTRLSHWAYVITGHLETTREAKGEAASLPLALCIAYLRARREI
jgi:hypothetical protein